MAANEKPARKQRDHLAMAMIFPLSIGTFTDGTPYFQADGRGLGLVEFNSSDGRFAGGVRWVGMRNPSYAIAGGPGRVLVVSEQYDRSGAVCLVGADDGAVGNDRILWEGSSRGLATCHLATLPGGKAVAAANYSSGSVIVLDAGDGSFVREWAYEGHGAHPERQKASHPHQCVVSPGGGWLLVPDLGCDAVWSHRIRDGIPLSEAVPNRLPAGTGPRHLVFHSDGKMVSALGELDGVVHTGRWDEESGHIEWVQHLPTVPGTAAPQASGSAIKAHPSLPILYAANRSLHDLAVMRLSPHGLPTLIGRIEPGVKVPRDFAVSPDGRWLLAAGQESGGIVVFPLDAESGLTSGPGVPALDVASPVCLAWMAR